MRSVNLSDRCSFCIRASYESLIVKGKGLKKRVILHFCRPHRVELQRDMVKFGDKYDMQLKQIFKRVRS